MGICHRASVPTLLLAVVLPGLGTPLPGTAQPWTPDRVDADRYARAERFLSSSTEGLVFGASVRPVWLENGDFWYWNDVPGGREVIRVRTGDGTPGTATRDRAFDHGRLAAAVAEATDTAAAALDLPGSGGRLDGEGRAYLFRLGETSWRCDLETYRCQADPRGSGDDPVPAGVRSPDGRRIAFLREHDLWVREVETGEELRITDDGTEDFGYATNNAGWTRSPRPVVRWSPDSRKIATFRHDARGVGMMYLTTTEVGHPRLDAWRYPLPEDSVIFRIHRLVVELDAEDGPRIIPFQMDPDPHRSTVCDHVYCGGTFADVRWAPDGSSVAFVSSTRDHKRATLRIADAASGAVRDVLLETEPTFVETGGNWRYLPASQEVVWYSQRDDWGHLYLVDAGTGEVKNRITGGEWNVREVLEVDEEERTVTFVGNGREPGDPYFRYLYRVGLDGGDIRLLTPDSADHRVELSPDGRLFVDTWSTPTTPPVSVLRDRDGRVVTRLEAADISRLEEAGWQPPLPFTVKARDGETDLYGLLFRPTDLDPDRRYPVVNYVYPGPQSGSIRTRSFAAARRDHQALAELGFVVVALDAMGTPHRSKTFHEFYYGNMGDNGLPDQIAAIRQLAERHPWIDAERVGIWGHSGGGFAAAGGVFRHPDVYDVAVSQAGNHDNRNYEDDWGEKWQGLLETRPDGSTTYDNQANQLVADQLQGKLLLAHGTLDDNVPPSNTLLVVDALIEANKDFDLILFPNRRHGFSSEPYMMRRRWDYFVEHLLGAEPPPAYTFGELEPAGSE
jgi:dipeptidyl aminopeptidase/acylaminoacyl peptidase